MSRYDILLNDPKNHTTTEREGIKKASHAPAQRAPDPVSPSQEPIKDVPERSNARTPVRSNVRRIITRNSFEVYEDQMDSLRELSYQEKREGRIGSMSAMVREALDTYLREKAKR